MEFLARLAGEGKLKKNFKTGAGQISYHMPCHLRAQNVGYKTRDVLALLPDTKIKVIEECSGHNGTWAMKSENFQQSLKWGSRALDAISEGNPKVTCSDWPHGRYSNRTGNRPPANESDADIGKELSWRDDRLTGTNLGLSGR
jgi:Fe-S oxidoreductase